MKFRHCPRNREPNFGEVGNLAPNVGYRTILRVGRSEVNMKIFHWVWVLIAATLTMSAQGSSGQIEGTVSSANVPVPGVSIFLTKAGDAAPFRSAVTDVQGRYNIRVAPGSYYLEARKEIAGVTYRSGPNSIEIATGERLVLDLRISTAAINELVTVSAAAEQTIQQVSKSVNVITGQEMRDRADFSLVDSLRTIPGFRVQQLGGFGHTANIKTRGLRNQDTAVLIDGIRFRDPAAITGDATPFLGDFTLTNVSRVEVLRGSASSLYGTNAVGGVVDFQTPTAPRGFHGQLSGAVGGLGLGRFRGNVSNGTKDGKFGFTAGASRTVLTKGIDGHDDANNTNAQFRFDAAPKTKTSFSVRFFLSDAFVRLNSNPDTFGTLPLTSFGIINAREGVNFVADVDDPDDTQRSKFFDGQFVFNQVLSDQVSLQGYYSGLKTSRKNVSGPLGVRFQSASTSTFGGLIQTANAHVDWASKGINRLTAGYEFEHEKFRNDGSTPGGTGDFFTSASQSSNTLYVQDLVTLFGGRLSLAGGARVQFFNMKDPGCSLTNCPYSALSLDDPPNAYTFDGSAAYTFKGSGTKLRAHVGNGYRVPSLFERFGTFFSSFGSPSFVALGDPNLKPERSIAFDGGVEQRIGPRIDVTAVFFYTKLIDTIGFGNVVPDIGPTARPFGGYENQKGGLARGLEFSGKARPSRSTDIFASYTFTNSEQRQPQIFGSGVIASLGLPAHQFTLVATQRIRRFWVNFDLLATNSYLAPIFSNASFSTYVYRFDGNRRADLTAGYTVPIRGDRLNIRVFATVENLFDTEYLENGFRTAGQTVRAGASFSF